MLNAGVATWLWCTYLLCKVKRWWMWITWHCHSVQFCASKVEHPESISLIDPGSPTMESANWVNYHIICDSPVAIASYCLILVSHDVTAIRSCYQPCLEVWVESKRSVNSELVQIWELFVICFVLDHFFRIQIVTLGMKRCVPTTGALSSLN